MSDWDDTRIDAAYRARYAIAPPPNLDARIASELSVAPRPAPWWLSFRVAASGLAATIVVLAIVVATAPLGQAPATGSSTAPGGTSPLGGPASSSVSPGGTAAHGIGWPFPDSVTTAKGTFPVQSVAAAIGVRAGYSGPVEIAVGGWQADSPAKRFCPAVLRDPVSQLQSACDDDRWLGATPQPNTDWSLAPPRQPAVRILAVTWRAGDHEIHFEGRSVGVVFVGHFHDPMAAQCRPENHDLCDSTFVVDDVAWTLSSTAFHAPPAGVDVAPMTVTEALAVRDSGAATEIAVEGWYTSTPVPCPHPAGQSRPLEDCLFDFTWLMANKETLGTTASDGSGSIHAPVGPAISLATFTSSGGTEPVEAIVIGHFNDVGATQCPAGPRRTACEQRFVVDDGTMLASGKAFTPFGP